VKALHPAAHAESVFAADIVQVIGYGVIFADAAHEVDALGGAIIDGATVVPPPPTTTEPGLPPGRNSRLLGISLAGFRISVEYVRAKPTVAN